jgi:hypothetical protein
MRVGEGKNAAVPIMRTRIIKKQSAITVTGKDIISRTVGDLEEKKVRDQTRRGIKEETYENKLRTQPRCWSSKRTMRSQAQL